MINLLGKLGGWKGYAALAVVIGLIAATWTIQGWRYTAKIARLESEHDREVAAQAKAAVDAVEAMRTEERRRTAAVEEARDEAQKQARAAANDAAGVRFELGRLRGRANALARAAVARDPAAANGSASGADAIDLLAYMLGSVSDRATELAGIADRARIAGLTCERAYDSLRVGIGSR